MNRPAVRCLFAVALSAAVIFTLKARPAGAALSLQIGPQNSPNTPDVIITKGQVPPSRGFLDLIFNDDSTENEGLFAYDLSLYVVRPAGRTGGIFLEGAERPPSDFVLSDDPTKSTFSVAESTRDHLLVNVSSNNDLFDITAGKKAARVFYRTDGDCLGEYKIVFDTANTVFGSGDPNRPDPAIVVSMVDTGFFPACPEPGGLLSLAAAGGMLAMRRRRQLGMPRARV